MDYREYIDKIKEFQIKFLIFIEKEYEIEENFISLTNYITEQNINNDRYLIKSLFYLISFVAKNHFRGEKFFSKIERILQYYQDIIKNNFSNDELFKIFKGNQLILLFLFQEKMLKIDESIYQQLTNPKSLKMNLHYFFLPEIKQFASEETKMNKEIMNKKLSDNFNYNRLQGENHHSICQVIRKDLIEEFIAYVNENQFSLTTIIENSIYETNQFLIGKKSTLIEYASFFGSTRIFKYLYENGVELKSSLWLYAIHGDCKEIIHTLEEKKIVPTDESYEECFIESIKCHHNEIANYIKNSFLDEKYKTLKIAIIRDQIDIIELFLKEKELIEPNIFYSCNELKRITIPHSITEIGSGAFSFCSSLTVVSIPSSVSTIGDYAFYECSSLTQIKIPSSVNEIGLEAFSGCSSLKRIEIPSFVTEIKSGLFERCSSLEHISIPSSITKIGNDAFYGCSSLKQFEIPSSVKSIENNTFSGCSSLTKVFIPSSVTQIGNYAFLRCSSLTELVIPTSVRSIGRDAFSECSSLQNLSIPHSIHNLNIPIITKVTKI